MGFLRREKTGCRRRNVNKEDIFLLGGSRVVMGSNPGELLGAQDGQPSFSSTSVSSSCLTKFFLKFGSLGIGRIYWQIYFFKIVVVGHQIFKTDWFWNGDVPKTMNQSFGNPAMKYSVQSRKIATILNWLVLQYFNETTEAGELQIRAQ